MGHTLGMDCLLYRCATALDGDSNTPALATWLECEKVRDLNISQTKGLADITTRDNNGDRAQVGTLRERSLNFDMLYDTDDADFAAILYAYNNNTLIALAAMDGAIDSTGSEGLTANFSITECSRDESLEEGVKASIVAVPSTIIAWYEVTGS